MSLHPCHHAQQHPERAAFIVADSGQAVSYRELDEGSNQLAHLFRQSGLQPGDRIGVMLRNSVEFPLVYWAAQRSGLMMALLSTHLKTSEAAYILNDCGARALIFSSDIGDTPLQLAREAGDRVPDIEHVFDTARVTVPGTKSLKDAMAPLPRTPVADQVSGYHFLYSSGTTGRPKGIMHKFEPGPIDRLSPSDSSTALYEAFDPLVTFNAGPVYHGAPLNTMLVTQRLGGTFVTLSKFDARQTLEAIERYHVVAAQFVPTMFVRLLALPEEVRDAADLSSLKYVLHAAAPCPIAVKEQMIEWLGPIVDEYYGATENIGATYIRAEEWLRKRGSVGKSMLGPIHICDEDGRELPPGEDGLVYFELVPGRGFDYLNDPDKTDSARHPDHHDWFAVGDIGHLDEEGYLFLTDRKDFTIISGGVNIYPQMIEDTLICHPKVVDAAVIGVPDPEYGERVMAIVEPGEDVAADGELERELDRWCREQMSKVTCPKLYRFVEQLPRLPSGKLAKKELRKRFGAETPWDH